MRALQGKLLTTCYTCVTYISTLRKVESSPTFSATCDALFHCEASCKEGRYMCNVLRNLSCNGSPQRCIHIEGCKKKFSSYSSTLSFPCKVNQQITLHLYEGKLTSSQYKTEDKNPKVFEKILQQKPITKNCHQDS